MKKKFVTFKLEIIVFREGDLIGIDEQEWCWSMVVKCIMT